MVSLLLTILSSSKFKLVSFGCGLSLDSFKDYFITNEQNNFFNVLRNNEGYFDEIFKGTFIMTQNQFLLFLCHIQSKNESPLLPLEIMSHSATCPNPNPAFCYIKLYQLLDTSSKPCYALSNTRTLALFQTLVHFQSLYWLNYWRSK